MPTTPSDGLRFACQPGCTRCCDKEGFVYLTEEDLNKAAAFLKLIPQEFERRYVYRTRRQRRLRKPPDSQCAFLTKEGCGIHPVKPTQCRLFPFWPHLVASPVEWEKTAAWCPGIGQGELIQIGAARKTAEEMKTAYPGFF
ncbi:MAG: YkgJ family cysteine cluster protein [Bryobacteraceae bacterium]